MIALKNIASIDRKERPACNNGLAKFAAQCFV